MQLYMHDTARGTLQHICVNLHRTHKTFLVNVITRLMTTYSHRGAKQSSVLMLLSSSSW